MVVEAEEERTIRKWWNVCGFRWPARRKAPDAIVCIYFWAVFAQAFIRGGERATMRTSDGRWSLFDGPLICGHSDLVWFSSHDVLAPFCAQEAPLFGGETGVGEGCLCVC